MTKSAQQSTEFEASVECLQGSLGWTIARVPFDPVAAWPQKIRLHVKGSINGFAFRTSLFPFAGEEGKYFLLVTKAMQAAAKVRPGHTAIFVLEPDLDPREAELPEELDALLDEEEGLRVWYESLSEYTRREIGKWAQDVKSDEARQRRAQQMAERMYFTMEAERDLPPAIAKAFKSRPKAQAGWAKMTPTQRRMGLFAVAYYQTPESQAKRLAKLLDEAEKKA